MSTAAKGSKGQMRSKGKPDRASLLCAGDEFALGYGCVYREENGMDK